jgi:hypothetical protein
MKLIVALVIIGLMLTTIPLATVDAQDYYELYKPTMTGPKITVTYPQNGSTIQSNSIQLCFNVTKPQIIKLSPNIPSSIIERNGVRNNSGSITRVYYKVDWQTKETNLYSNQDSEVEFLEFNETISNIPDGTHKVEINTAGSVNLIVAMFGVTYRSEANSTVVFTSNFESIPAPSISSDRNAPHLDPIYYLIPVSVILTVVIASLLLYRRDRKTAQLNK